MSALLLVEFQATLRPKADQIMRRKRRARLAGHRMLPRSGTCTAASQAYRFQGADCWSLPTQPVACTAPGYQQLRISKRYTKLRHTFSYQSIARPPSQFNLVYRPLISRSKWKICSVCVFVIYSYHRIVRNCLPIWTAPPVKP